MLQPFLQDNLAVRLDFLSPYGAMHRTGRRAGHGVEFFYNAVPVPSASAMHSTVWREEVEPDSEIILQERLQHEVSKILLQAGRKAK